MTSPASHERIIVWAFEPLDELGGATGFVECDVALADALIAAGRAQDPRIGGLLLRPIAAPGRYATRELKPAAPGAAPDGAAIRRGPGHPRKVTSA